MGYNVGRGLIEPVIDPMSLAEMKFEMNLTTKQRLDLDKIRRSPFPHSYYLEAWALWTGNGYIKTWYDVQLPCGTVLHHFWPNAGKLCGQGKEYGVEDEVMVRLSETSPFA